jgi:GMP synthase (glutamine-hydrolysing)
MPSVAVIRHVHFEDLGAFASVFEHRGCSITYIDVGRVDLPEAAASADLVVILGGPIGAYDDDLYPVLGQELDLLEHRLRTRAPILGICLGAQLIARALGANVYRGPAKEIGWSRLTLSDRGRLSPLKAFDDAEVLHWHGDTFDLPIGAELLASTPLCANQAFAIGNHVLAFQFHPEAQAEGFERWLIGHTTQNSP